MGAGVVGVGIIGGRVGADQRVNRYRYKNEGGYALEVMSGSTREAMVCLVRAVRAEEAGFAVCQDFVDLRRIETLRDGHWEWVT